jgi:hypothetical protein
LRRAIQLRTSNTKPQTKAARFATEGLKRFMNKRKWTCLFFLAALSIATLCIGWGNKTRTTEDLLKIAASGGGLVLDARGRNIIDLMEIAAQCADSNNTLYLKNCGGFATIDLMKIAAAGHHHVVVEL